MTRITWTPLHNTMLRRVSHKKPSYHTHSDSKLLFPHFKKLELSDRETIESFVSEYPPYSDFNFTSLWSYNVHDEAEFSFLNDNLVVKFHDYITGEPFYTFIGENKPVETVETLLKSAQENGLAHKLKLIPEVVAKALANYKHNFSIVEDHANHDYVYSVKDHAELKGRLFQDKRQLVNHFTKNYPDHKVSFLDVREWGAREEVVKLFLTWEEIKHASKEETEHEFRAVNRILDAAQHLNLQTIGIYVNNNLIAFSISNVCQGNHAVAHFEKVHKDFKGASAVIRHEVAKHMQKKNVEFINYEQDLGIEGLRKAKQYWNPTHFLKKYTISSLT